MMSLWFVCVWWGYVKVVITRVVLKEKNVIVLGIDTVIVTIVSEKGKHYLSLIVLWYQLL